MSCITEISHSVLPQGLGVHAHDGHELIFICSGTAVMNTSSGRHTVRAPALVSIGHLEKHAVSASGKYERYVLILKPEQLPAGAERFQMFFVPQFQVLNVAPVFGPVKVLFDLLLAEHGRGEPSGGESWLLLSMLLLLFRNFPEAFPSGSGIVQTMRSVQAVLEQNMSETILLSALAARFHISVGYLCHTFKKVTGYGVLQYRLMVRLAFACGLLSGTGESISSIAEKSGFPDASSFARQFKKSLGCTPGQYRSRKASRQGEESSSQKAFRDAFLG